MNDNRSSEIKKRVFRDEVAEHIVNEIVSGRLNPGDRIVETRVSKELQVSQGAVREAIRDLIAKGMLYSEAYKGTYVREFSTDEIKDYYKVRTVIERTALLWMMTGTRRQELVTELKALVDGMEKVSSSGDVTHLNHLDITFHRTLVKGADSETLFKAWESMGNLFWLAVGIGRIARKDELDALIRGHKEIVDGIERNEIEHVATLLESHFEKATNMVEENLG